MARLKEYNGHYCESEYEYAFIGFLEAEGWKYSSGNNIHRVTKRDVLIADDFKKFIADTNPDLTEDEVTQIYDNVRLVGAESNFATLHKVYGWMVNGVQFTSQDGLPRMISLIDFDNWDKNIFRVVNQFTVEYTNNGQKENRRPDVLLFVNGMPLCVVELKNPVDANATIYDAWEQINIRYWRDIPHLLHYCPLACISDGVKTRLGTVRTPYEHFYAWRRVNEGDVVSTLPFAETETMIKGVYTPERFVEIFRDYIYFQDSIYDSDEVEIVCRYPQFFAAKLLKQSIVNSVVTRSGKGGTYFGATGCGKTYTMAFLARQLALRCTDIPEIGSPTIILIVDRDELQKQGSKLFTKSKEFLNLGEVSVVKNRTQLRQELGARQSGGFYICTIQKFCDREDDKIGLINDRQNIICFSDEAHRTQLEHSKKIQFSKDADENMKAMVSKPYAKVLKEAFPHATFVGFTGTPIAETYQTFGDEIDRYTMDQAVADGLTVSIKYHPRIAKVLLDNKKVKEIENYYKKCADDGATYEDIEASKKAMSSMEIILGEPSRLERLATDIHNHYVASCAGDPDRIQKAMVVCSNRKIAYALLQKFKDKYPEWFEEKKSPDGVSVTEEELKELKPMPFMAMVSSVGSNDEKDMYDYLGGVKNDKREAFIKSNCKMKWRKTANSREEMPEYVERSYHEALVNALAHRDYLVNGSEVHIDIYDDRMEIYSPGGMPDGSIIQDRDPLIVPSTRRNSILADVFNRLGYMERKGSGFGKIISGYEFQINYDESKRPSFRSDRYQFTVVMPNLNYDVSQEFEENKTMSESMSKLMSESMSELERTRMQIILHYLDTNKEINSSIAAKLLKVEIKTASRLLSKAEKLYILNSYGKTKNKVYFRE